MSSVDMVPSVLELLEPMLQLLDGSTELRMTSVVRPYNMSCITRRAAVGGTIRISSNLYPPFGIRYSVHIRALFPADVFPPLSVIFTKEVVQVEQS